MFKAFGAFVFACCVFVLIALAVGGCSTTSTVLQDIGMKGKPEDPANLIDAANLAWKSLGRVDLPPQVLVVAGDDLTCIDPNSHNPGFAVFTMSGPTCREGYTLLPFAVSVAYHFQPWHSSALVHEFEHVKLIRSGITGTDSKILLGDPNHTLPVWQTGGEVDQVNGQLAIAGF